MKRKLRLFADYMAGTPLWESWDEHDNDYWNEGEYNKSKETLRSFGVSEHVLSLMQSMMFVFEYPSAFEEWPGHYLKAYEGLRDVIKEHLDMEIGDKFEIEVIE